MKKHWLTIVEIVIAAVGLVGWILSNNVTVALVAALLVFAFGISKPLFEARKSLRRERFVDRQFDRAQEEIDERTTALLAGLPEPGLPGPAVVHGVIEMTDEIDVERQKRAADLIVEMFQQQESLPEIERWIARLEVPALARHFQALVSLRKGEIELAGMLFQENSQERSAWAEAWYGWLHCQFVMGNDETVIANNPQTNGVELSPYGPVNEDQFIEMNDDERQRSIDDFQTAMAGIGDLYAAASLRQSTSQLEQSRQEYRKAA